MTGLATTLTAMAAVGAAAIAGASGPDGVASAPAALVIDASIARDGRDLVDPRLEGTGAEVRLPRTAEEARTNVRYFTELGYRVVVAGPRASEAAVHSGAGAEVAPGLPAAVSALSR